ncbi:orcokinin peptides type A-like isoform X1 [Macrosteles quadrilineatus]|uniref:orcokinin peptides type A-like isoform X1 n=1 Tax=Macrosteles quadrilineatus TaxID=74068 RepID=UPI0023E31F62|nr:orcokinin peptides type A-like isoform X1 [Macrosteles quadrilineatus]
MAYSDIAVLLAVTLATLAITLAYPTKDDDAYYNRLHEIQDSYGKDVRNLDGIDARDEVRPLFGFLSKTQDNENQQTGGGNLLRDLDMLRSRAAYLSRDQRPQAYLEPVLGNKRSGCCDSLSGIGIGNQKRNMDEIDRSSFNSFIKKNFDEIDRSGFGSFVKRNFDEIDRSGFGSFVKRNAAPAAPAEPAHN